MNNKKLDTIIDKLVKNQNAADEELLFILEDANKGNISDSLMLAARKVCNEIYGPNLYIRGLIEFTNCCRNDCFYCGIRRSNSTINRFQLRKNDIFESVDRGYALGFRTVVLQGGEDMTYTDGFYCDLIEEIKKKYSDMAVTLSIGERSRISYVNYYNAGADRYLIRHETASKEHYAKLHPNYMSFENRMRCLKDLKEIGYQVGCGMMIGSPYQTLENILLDLRFIKKFNPHMVGIGPFIPHKDTVFKNEKAGSISLTLTVLSLVRLMLPYVLLPATTALDTICEDGLRLGVKAGCNVCMPNLSPEKAKKNYMLYNDKKIVGTEAAENLNTLKESMAEIGINIPVSRGDYITSKLRSNS